MIGEYGTKRHWLSPGKCTSIGDSSKAFAEYKWNAFTQHPWAPDNPYFRDPGQGYETVLESATVEEAETFAAKNGMRISMHLF